MGKPDAAGKPHKQGVKAIAFPQSATGIQAASGHGSTTDVLSLLHVGITSHLSIEQTHPPPPPIPKLSPVPSIHLCTPTSGASSLRNSSAFHPFTSF